MIFVAVGNARQGFERLMEAIDALQGAGVIGGELVVQYGNSRSVPRNCRAVPFVGREEFRELISRASLVITHGGAGSIGLCLLHGKKPVVVPRRKIFGEIVNDHQVELARELEGQGRIFAAMEMADLAAVVRTALNEGAEQPPGEGRGGVREILKGYLDRLVEEKEGRSPW